MNTPFRLALATLAAALSPLAFAHATLVDSFPAKGQTLTGSPAEIHLTFNEHVEPRYCRIKLVSDSGKNFDADRPAADKTKPNAIVAAIPVLKPGRYSARWTAVGSDGHKTHGDFSFTVAK
ncbi:MAG: copper resistance CopC family protein [Burkholderiaceae bacterium]